MHKREVRSGGIQCQKKVVSQCLSFSFSSFFDFVFYPLCHLLSMLVFGMVLDGRFLFFHLLLFSPLFLTAVTELISIVRTEVSIAPNVELNGNTDIFY